MNTHYFDSLEVISPSKAAPHWQGDIFFFLFRTRLSRLFFGVALLFSLGTQQSMAQEFHVYRLNRVILSSQDPWPTHWLTWLDYNAGAVIAYNNTYIGAPTKPDFKFNCFFYSNREEFVKATGIAGSTVGVTQTLGETHTIHSYNQDLIKTHEGWKVEYTGDTFCTILHEMCHAIHFCGFGKQSYGAPPMVFQEGLADYIAEQFWYVSIPKKESRRNELKAMLKQIDLGALPPLRRFLSASSYDEWNELFEGNGGTARGYAYAKFLTEYFLSNPKRADTFHKIMSSLRGIEISQERKNALFVGAVDALYPTVERLQGDFYVYLKEKAIRYNDRDKEILQWQNAYKTNQENLDKLLKQHRSTIGKGKTISDKEKKIFINAWLSTVRSETEYWRVDGFFSEDPAHMADIHHRCLDISQLVKDLTKDYKKQITDDRYLLIKDPDILLTTAYKMIPVAIDISGITGTGSNLHTLPPLDAITKLPIDLNPTQIPASHVESLFDALLKRLPR